VFLGCGKLERRIEHRRILPEVIVLTRLVHRAGAGKEVPDIKADACCERKADLGKDGEAAADAAVQMAVAILRGEQPQVNDTTTYDNGVRVVPSYLLKSQIITKDDVRAALIDTGYVTEEELR